MSRVPQVPEESSTTRHSYIAKSGYDGYIAKQKKQSATVAVLEKVYSDLATSHRDLKESSKKMVKREKKRNKFFRKL